MAPGKQVCYDAIRRHPIEHECQNWRIKSISRPLRQIREKIALKAKKEIDRIAEKADERRQ